jgi:hypothetical protein
MHETATVGSGAWCPPGLHLSTPVADNRAERTSEGMVMLETLVYLAAAIATIAILVKLAPPGTSVIRLVTAAIALVAVLATARHGPTALVDVLDALARLLR